MSDSSFRLIVVGLLVSLLIVQVGIWEKQAKLITVASIKSAPASQRANLIQQIPLVRVHGSVDVDVLNTIDVEVQNTVGVEVENTPLPITTY